MGFVGVLFGGVQCGLIRVYITRKTESNRFDPEHQCKQTVRCTTNMAAWLHVVHIVACGKNN